MDTQFLPQIDLSRCTGCGDCITGCPQGALTLQDQRPRLAKPQDCTFCTNCEALCATRAIQCAFEITWDDPASPEINS